MAKVKRLITENYRAELTYSPAVVAAILDRCQEVESGARNVDHILNGTLLPEMSKEFLGRLAEGETISAASIDVDEEGAFTYKIG